MTGRLRARLTAVLVVGAIWLGAAAVPVSAAGVVRYVDDNPNSTSCHGTRRHSIQNTINISNPGDTVLVCPGTYHEELVIDIPNLTVMSSQYRKAKLLPPDQEELSNGAMVVIAADGVTFRGFQIRIPGGPAGPTGVSSCRGYEAAIVVLSQRVKVWGNRIDATGENTLSGECGYLAGIVVLGEEPLPALPNLGTNRISLKRNYIRDFKLFGILALGEGANVRMFWNSIRFVHQDDPATCVPVNTFQVGPTVQQVCDTPFATDLSESRFLQGIQTGGFLVPFVGILVGDGAKTDVGHNTVYSVLEIDQVAAAEVNTGIFGPSIFLLFGILSVDSAPGSRITENVVQQNLVGIAVDPETIAFVTGVPDNTAPNGTLVTFNRAFENIFGFHIDGEENLLYANRARLNFFGVVTDSGHHNTFRENDFRYNYPFGSYDCRDETTGDGDHGTDNFWEENLGNNNDPEAICIATSTF